MPKGKFVHVRPSFVGLVGTCVTRTAIVILALVVGVLGITSSAVAQAAAAPPAAPPALQPPSGFKFKVPSVPKPKPGTAFAFDLCHNKAVDLPKGNNTDWDMFAKDTGQGECNGPFDKQPTTVSGTDGPVHFVLAPGGFPPIGMHLGMNGLLYGTPTAKSVFAPKPFSICAVTLGGAQDCHEVNLAAAPPSHALPIALLGGGAAVAAVGATMAMKGTSTGSGGGCGSPPANLFNDCFSNPQSPNCPADLQAQGAFCKCNGYSGFNAESGSCQ